MTTVVRGQACNRLREVACGETLTESPDQTIRLMESTIRTLATRILLLMVTAVSASQAGCIAPSSSNGKITKQPFGSTSDRTPIDLYILQNNTGIEAKICNYGESNVMKRGCGGYTLHPCLSQRSPPGHSRQSDQ